MNKYNMPKVWYVLYNTRHEFDILKEYYNKSWQYYHSNNDKGYCNHDKRNNWINLSVKNDGYSEEDLKKLEAVEISFKDWEEIFIYKRTISIDKDQEKGNLTHLVNLLKQI